MLIGGSALAMGITAAVARDPLPPDGQLEAFARALLQAESLDEQKIRKATGLDAALA